MKFVKWLGIGLAGLAIVFVVALLGARAVSANKLAATWPVRDFPVPALPTDEAGLAEGERLFAARGCAECHGVDGSGRTVIDDPVLGQVRGSNLTRGRGGLAPTFSDADFVRALQHCVRPDGSSIVLMPCEETQLLPERELAAILAHVNRLPAVDNEAKRVELGPLGHALHGFGVVSLLSTAKLDFDGKIPPAPEAGPTVAFGERLAQIQCVGCHGNSLSGGPMPGMPPSVPVPTNITVDEASGIGQWSKADFVQLLRTGRRPDGTAVNPFMPWSVYRHLNDTEIEAIWAYVRSRPAKAYGNR